MAYITLLLLNGIYATGWVTLAIHFDKWWLALFMLFTMYKATKSKEE